MAYLATDELKKDGEQVKKYLVYMAYSLEKKMSKVSTKQVVLKTHYMGCNFWMIDFVWLGFFSLFPV